LSETTYRWDGENIIGEEDEFGNVVDYFVMPFSLMDNVVSMKREGQDYYYLTDVMGSVYQVVDADGNVVNSYDHNAWGEVRESGTTEAVANPFRWQTKPWDEETGLYYSRARYYDGRTGRFVSQDMLYKEGNQFAWGPPAPPSSQDPTGQYGEIGFRPVFRPDRRRITLGLYEAWEERQEMKKRSKERDPHVTDTYHHCMAACKLTRRTEPDFAKSCMEWWEILQLFLQDYSPYVWYQELKKDMPANMTGINCPKGKSCRDCCCDYEN